MLPPSPCSFHPASALPLVPWPPEQVGWVMGVTERKAAIFWAPAFWKNVLLLILTKVSSRRLGGDQKPPETQRASGKAGSQIQIPYSKTMAFPAGCLQEVLGVALFTGCGGRASGSSSGVQVSEPFLDNEHTNASHTQ